LLSDFGTAGFSHVTAVSNQTPVGGPISDFPHRSLDMMPAGTLLATSGPLTNTSTQSSFSVTWDAAG
jgi:hypothetical protein